ncbi:MAG: hypothetical protein Kow00109_21980 [Acidobacteriota bacterium]
MSEWKVRPVSVPELHRFMRHHVYKSFDDLGSSGIHLADYLVEVLVRFARTENLFPWGALSQKRLAYLVDYLLEAVAQEESAGGLRQEKNLRRQIGDFSLFMSGVFRDYVRHRGILDFYFREGSLSYRRAAELQRRLFEPGAARFDELAERFEELSGVLDYMSRVYFRTGRASGRSADPFAGLDA